MEEIFVTSHYRLSLSPNQQQPPFIWPDTEWAIILPTSFTLFILPPFPSSSSALDAGGADGSACRSRCASLFFSSLVFVVLPVSQRGEPGPLNVHREREGPLLFLLASRVATKDADTG